MNSPSRDNAGKQNRDVYLENDKMKINPKRMAGKTGGRSLALMLAGLAAMASFRANATFTESKLNDIAVKNDGGSIIVYHAGTGGNPSAAFDGNTDTYYENADVYNKIGWVGLGISSPRNLSKVRYMPRSDQARRMRDCLIQGANNSDFSDAVTLHVIKNADNASGDWIEEEVATEAGLCHTISVCMLLIAIRDIGLPIPVPAAAMWSSLSFTAANCQLTKVRPPRRS